jgi:DNA-binding transcriptional MerR regulator
MFRIGEFSKLSHVPAKTLRYYDQIGLLAPAEVDRFTGYRYYSASQLPRLHRILAMKDLGLSLSQIGQLLEEDLSTDQIRGMLLLKRTEIQQQVEAEQARLARVEWRLKQIEEEISMKVSSPPER